MKKIFSLILIGAGLEVGAMNPDSDPNQMDIWRSSVFQVNPEHFRSIIRETIEEVLGENFDRNHEIIEPVVRALDGTMKREEETRIVLIKELCQVEKDRLKDFYEHQIASLNVRLAVAEEKAELTRKIGSFLVQNIIKPEETERKLISLDLPERYKALSKIYNEKFEPFRTELNPEDLTEVHDYMGKINVSIPTRTEIGDLWNKIPNGKPSLAGYLNVEEINKAITYGAKFKEKEKDLYYYFFYGTNLQNASRMESERQRINTEIQNERNAYNRARAIPFPSAAFRRIAEKINELFRRIL